MRHIYSLGIMTGTSCDGADLALLKLTPQASDQLLQVTSKTFPRNLRKALRSAQAGKINIVEAAILGRNYSLWLSQLCKSALKQQKNTIKKTLISVHGQTIWHQPQDGISIQLIDPTILSYETGCTVTSMFRQPDLARGGEGAPLVPYYHWLRATSLSEFSKLIPFVIYNIGGIANLTYVGKKLSNLIAFDSGPGNVLIDLAVENLTAGKKHFDKNGHIAARHINKVSLRMVERAANHPYFGRHPPKSTGLELFNENYLHKFFLKDPLQVAYATAFTAHTMARATHDLIKTRQTPARKIYLSGGGAKNPVLVAFFQKELLRLTGQNTPVSNLPSTFAPTQHLEAMAFAHLGLQALLGKPVSLAVVTGACEDAIGAGIFPGKNYSALRDCIKDF